MKGRVCMSIYYCVEITIYNDGQTEVKLSEKTSTRKPENTFKRYDDRKEIKKYFYNKDTAEYVAKFTEEELPK